MKCGMPTAQCSRRTSSAWGRVTVRLWLRPVGLLQTGDEFPKTSDFQRFLASLTLVIRRCGLVGMLAMRKQSRGRRATSWNSERTRGLLLEAAFEEMYHSVGMNWRSSGPYSGTMRYKKNISGRIDEGLAKGVDGTYPWRFWSQRTTMTF